MCSRCQYEVAELVRRCHLLVSVAETCRLYNLLLTTDD